MIEILVIIVVISQALLVLWFTKSVVSINHTYQWKRVKCRDEQAEPEESRVSSVSHP